MDDQVFRVVMECAATGQTWEQRRLAPNAETALQNFVRQKRIVKHLMGDNYFRFKVEVSHADG